MASTGTAVPPAVGGNAVLENDLQLEGHSPAESAEPEPQVAEPFATAPSAKRARTSHPAPIDIEQLPAAPQRGALRVTSTDPLVYELEESSDPERRGFRRVAEPSPGDMLWMTSEDENNGRKWWRACNPDFAAALSDQMERGVPLAKFLFYPCYAGTKTKWQRTYTHDLQNMVQLDEDYERVCPLRLVSIVANNAGPTSSASRFLQPVSQS